MNQETGRKEESFEMVEVQVLEEYSRNVSNLFDNRKDKLHDMGLNNNRNSMPVIKYLIPTWGMLGLWLEMLSATRGTAIVDSVFDLYRKKITGNILSRDKGLLLAFKDNMVTAFGYEVVQDQGELFVESEIDVYKHMMSVVSVRQ